MSHILAHRFLTLAWIRNYADWALLMASLIIYIYVKSTVRKWKVWRKHSKTSSNLKMCLSDIQTDGTDAAR